MPFCKNCGYEIPADATFCPRCGTPATIPEESIAATTPSMPSAEPTLKLAYWWERVLAWLIDALIVGAVIWILGLFGFNPTITPTWPGLLTFFISLNLEGLFRFLYWMFMEGSSGQSFGKMVMRTKVVHLDGSPVNMGSAAVESLGKAFFLPLDLLIGWVLYPRKRQRLMNYASQTVVVKVS